MRISHHIGVGVVDVSVRVVAKRVLVEPHPGRNAKQKVAREGTKHSPDPRLVSDGVVAGVMQGHQADEGAKNTAHSRHQEGKREVVVAKKQLQRFERCNNRITDIQR
jgi:hypothetical protein